MPKIFVLALLLGISSISAGDVEEGQFQEFIAKHGRNYKSQAEYAKRLGHFKNRLRKIQDWNDNSASEKGWTKGLNQFADWSDEEFAAYLTVKVPKEDEQVSLPPPEKGRSLQSLPQNLDLRSWGVVTAVRDQGSCGSCWAFSTAANLESAAIFTYGSVYTYDLSEQNLVDCVYGAAGGCQGGWMATAGNYIITNGVLQEFQYPYTGQNGACQTSTAQKVRARGQRQLANDVISIKNGLYSGGAASVCVDAKDWASYRSGILTTPAPYTCNHAVAIIGWGVSSTGQFFWILKNSWGTWWGEQGYIKVAGDGTGGILTNTIHQLYF